MLDSLSIYLTSKTTKYVILHVPVPVILVQKDFKLKCNTLVQNGICENHSRAANEDHYMIHATCLAFFFPSKTEREKKSRYLSL